ncbi:MAG: hypothetical protein IJB42_04350 [Oscillospiraceae bacterium]|nr:hypothetical protein [Oscillospiraceae bacterium]MBQ2742660.1 hypothetical protein [Oscillospiraceae bacterium]MBQ3224920.1 hypothetical protein [Oscillospiraceae bacterium]MBQ4315980.1 hypothetical protein [Oscillospiraceae bacterium]MBQ6697446.1 hypothetical protein [Oscillospiraceae bacterium]
MPDKVLPGPIHGNPPCVKEAVCIHTKRIYDSCRDKECIENLRVYPTRCSQEILDCATSVKSRDAKLLWTNIDVRDVAFNRGFYSVDIRFFYYITAEVCACNGRTQKVKGLAIYDKNVILFGSEGDVKIFSSELPACSKCASNMPTAFVEAVDPIFLDADICEAKTVCSCTPPECECNCDELCDVPQCIKEYFDDELVVSGGCKNLLVTLGQFSIVRLERDSQILIPAYDFCMPEKECVGSSEDSPCDLFRKIKFPVGEFFPPSRAIPDNPPCDCKPVSYGCCGK